MVQIHSRRHDEEGFAGGRGHADARAPEGLPHADRDLAEHGLALALEQQMLAHARADDEITSRTTERSGAALAADRDLGSRIDARRDRHRHGFDAATHAAARAPRAGSLALVAAPPARLTG